MATLSELIRSHPSVTDADDPLAFLRNLENAYVHGDSMVSSKYVGISEEQNKIVMLLDNDKIPLSPPINLQIFNFQNPNLNFARLSYTHEPRGMPRLQRIRGIRSADYCFFICDERSPYNIARELDHLVNDLRLHGEKSDRYSQLLSI